MFIRLLGNKFYQIQFDKSFEELTSYLGSEEETLICLDKIKLPLGLRKCVTVRREWFMNKELILNSQ